MREEGESSSEEAPLFPEAGGFDPEFVSKALVTGNLAAILTHYRLHRFAETRGLANDAVIDLAREECGDA